jgi:hypothetical protein
MMKRAILIIGTIILVIGAFWLVGKNKQEAVPVQSEQATSTTKTYTSTTYDLSFTYPDYYYLEEKDIDLANRVHHQIILTEDTDENRLVREGKSPGREGPVAITIDIFQNNLDNITAEQFITGNSASNYKLGDGKMQNVTKGTISGIEYSWSGLYEGKSLVVAKPDYIYMFSVTRLEPSDRIAADFEGVLQTAAIQ